MAEWEGPIQEVLKKLEEKDGNNPDYLKSQ